MNFVKYSKIYFIFSGILVLASLVFVFAFGLNPGIEFTGGSILELRYLDSRPSEGEIREQLSSLNLGSFMLQPSDEKELILRMEEIDEQTHELILGKLREKANAEELRFESIGPVIGRELRDKAKLITLLSALAIVVYVAFAFRRLTFPVKSWQYGTVVLLTLFHDVVIPLGVFSVLGRFKGVQITIPVMVALLTILGYSVNNTVVIFDRIRENLIKKVGENYQAAVDKAINQNLGRTINTSLTTIFALAALYFFGGETLKYFSLALILGIATGTYTSILLAGPILVAWQKRRANHKF